MLHDNICSIFLWRTVSFKIVFKMLMISRVCVGVCSVWAAAWHSEMLRCRSSCGRARLCPPASGQPSLPHYCTHLLRTPLHCCTHGTGQPSLPHCFIHLCTAAHTAQVPHCFTPILLVMQKKNCFANFFLNLPIRYKKILWCIDIHVKCFIIFIKYLFE